MSGLSKELKNLSPEELLKHQLMALNQEYHCPVISLNVKGQENADVNKRRGGYRKSTLMNGTEHLQLAEIMKEVLSPAQLVNTSKN